MSNEDIVMGLSNCTKQIRELKEDVQELVDLVRLLAGILQMPVSGTEEEKTAIEFEARLQGLLQKHPRGHHHITNQKDAMEGEILA